MSSKNSERLLAGSGRGKYSSSTSAGTDNIAEGNIQLSPLRIGARRGYSPAPLRDVEIGVEDILPEERRPRGVSIGIQTSEQSHFLSFAERQNTASSSCNQLMTISTLIIFIQVCVN